MYVTQKVLLVQDVELATDQFERASSCAITRIIRQRSLHVRKVQGEWVPQLGFLMWPLEWVIRTHQLGMLRDPQRCTAKGSDITTEMVSLSPISLKFLEFVYMRLFHTIQKLQFLSYLLHRKKCMSNFKKTDQHRKSLKLFCSINLWLHWRKSLLLQCYFQTFFTEDKFINFKKCLMFVYLLPDNYQNKTKNVKYSS
jgi:hypothetical protein